jgi:hypothetical protein
LGADLRRTRRPLFFAIAALLKPANMLDSSERHGHQLHIRVFWRDSDLFSSLQRNVIDVFGSSETASRFFFLYNEPFLNQSCDVLLEGVVAEAYLALERSEAVEFAVF